MKINKIIVVILLVLTLNYFAFGVSCGSVPTDACTVSVDTNFTTGIYYLPSGITVDFEVVLDCKGSTILGQYGFLNGDTVGINVTHKNATIQNCIIKNYYANGTSGSYGDDDQREEIGILINAEYANIFNNTFENNLVAIKIYNQQRRNGIRIENNNIGNCSFIDYASFPTCFDFKKANNSIIRNNYFTGDFNVGALNIWGANHTIENNIFNCVYVNIGSNNPDEFATGLRLANNIFYNCPEYYNPVYDVSFQPAYLEISGESKDAVIVDNIFNNMTINIYDDINTVFCQGVKDNIYINSSSETGFNFPICSTDYFKIKYHEDFNRNYKFLNGNFSKRIFNLNDWNEARERYGYLKGTASDWALGYTKGGSITADVVIKTESNQDLINSRYGINYGFENPSVANVNAQVFFTSILNESIDFNDNDYLRFTCNNEESDLLSVTEKNYMYLIIGGTDLKTYTDNLMISLTNGGCQRRNSFDNPGTSDWAIPQQCIEISELSNLSCEDGKTIFDLQKKDIMKKINKLTPTYLDEIERFDFFFYSSGSYDTMGEFVDSYIDDLTIYNNPNELPNVSFTTEKEIYCYENNTKIVSVPIFFNITDLENNTIYYGTKVNTKIDKTKYISFQETLCFFDFCDAFLKTTATDNFITPFNNTCPINNTPNSQDFYFISGLDEIGAEQFYLYLRKDCSKSDKSIYYDIGKNVDFLNNELSFSSNNNGDRYNITYYDEIFNKQIVLGFERLNDVTYIYNYEPNKVLVTTLGLGSRFTTKVIVTTDNNFDLEIYNSSVFIDKIYSTTNLNRFDNLGIRYISVSVDNNSTILFKGGAFSYGQSIPEFSLIQPVNVTLIEFSNIITVYVTDDAHLNQNTYIKLTKEVSIVACNQYIQIDNSKDWKLATQNLNRGFCSTMSNLVYIPKLCNYLTWFVIFITFIISFIISGIFITIAPNLVWGIFLILFSLQNALISVLQFSEYSSGMNIFFIFVFALGVVTTVISIIYTPANSGV